MLNFLTAKPARVIAALATAFVFVGMLWGTGITGGFLSAGVCLGVWALMESMWSSGE